jgi:DNA-binding beta-propeller fold protein YncE
MRRVIFGVLVLCAGRALAQAPQPATGPLIPIEERVVATLTIPGGADFLALADSGAWVTNRGRVEKLLPGSPAPVATVPITRPCGAMGVGFGSLWVVDCRARSLVRVSLDSAKVQATIATGVADASGELSVAVGAGSVWLLSDSSGVLSRIDPRTDSVVARITVAAHSYAAVFGFDAVWITNTGARGSTGRGSVQRIDPRTNTVVATIPVGPTPRFLAAGAGGVWTLNQGDGTVSRIDPATNRQVATIDAGVPGGGGDIAAGANRVWIRASKILLQVVDPATNQIIARFGPPSGSGAVRASDAGVWITAHDIQKVWIIRG